PGSVETVPASEASAPATAPVSAPASVPAEEQLNSQLDTTAGAGSGTDNTPPQPTNREATDSQPSGFQPPAPSIVQPDNSASSANALTNGVQPTGASVSNISKRNVSRAGRGQNVDKRLARGESETAASTNTGAKPQSPIDLKPGDERRSDSSIKKGSNTTPQSIAPPTTSSTPKAKVIQWP
ncbi:MAG: hypothetical protein M3R67_13695, partial [Acidobacteriota bacterium]|nr:hypothetical protein [Acidobacteriota bacterium]